MSLEFHMKVNVNFKKIKRYWNSLTKITIKNIRRYCKLSSILQYNYLTTNYSQIHEVSPDLAISALEAEIEVYCYLILIKDK